MMITLIPIRAPLRRVPREEGNRRVYVRHACLGAVDQVRARAAREELGGGVGEQVGGEFLTDTVIDQRSMLMS